MEVLPDVQSKTFLSDMEAIIQVDLQEKERIVATRGLGVIKGVVWRMRSCGRRALYNWEPRFKLTTQMEELSILKYYPSEFPLPRRVAVVSLGRFASCLKIRCCSAVWSVRLVEAVGIS